MTITRVPRSSGSAYRIRVELPPDPETGRRRWHSETIAPAPDALKRAKVREAELIASVGRDQVQELGGRNVQRYLVDDWLPWLRRGVKESTWVTRESAVRLHIVPAWGGRRLSELQPLALQRWLDGLVAGGMAPNSAISLHATLSAALRQAERWRLIGSNPMPMVRAPSRERPAMTVWTIEEIGRFVIGEEDVMRRAMWAVLAGTGMRSGELLALRWDDIAWDRQAIRIDETQTKRQGGYTTGAVKTRSSLREVGVDAAVLVALRRHRVDQAARRLAWGEGWGQGDWVFDRGDGVRLLSQSACRWFARRREAEGLAEATMHDLRHAHATHLAAAGVPLAVIAQRLGHSGVNVLLSVYTHLSSEHHGAAIEAVAGVFSGMRDADVTRVG